MRYAGSLVFAVLCAVLLLSPPAIAAPHGDADGNGRLDLADAVFSLQSAAGLRSGGDLRSAIAALQIVAGMNPDFTPPGAPQLALPTDLDVGCNFTNLQCYAKLLWSPSSDDRGVAGYAIYRDSVRIGETQGNTFTGTFPFNPPAVTTCTFHVRSFDAAGNLSQESNLLRITTPSSPAVSVVVSGNVTS